MKQLDPNAPTYPVETKTEDDFQKVVCFREQLHSLLEDKVNIEHSKFPNDMHLVKDIEDLIKDNKEAVLQIIDKSTSPYNISFETQYQLDCFREIESDVFDYDGLKFISCNVSDDTAESMLKLINQMELEIKALLNELNKEVKNGN